jgi:hypothetical protein
MNKIEIIDEVVKHFSTHPRSKAADGHCCYLNGEGHRCAHSIFLRDDFVKELNYKENTSSSAESIITKYGDDCHKEEYVNISSSNLLLNYLIMADVKPGKPY